MPTSLAALFQREWNLLRLRSRGNAGAEGRGTWQANWSPSPLSGPGLLASFQPSPKGTTSASSKGPSWREERQGQRRGLLCGARSQGLEGIHHLKAGVTCNFIPWEEEPEKSARRGGDGGVGQPGELFWEGRDLARSPKPSQSLNFHQSLGPRLPETKTQQALEEPRAAQRGGRTRGGTTPRRLMQLSL